MASAAKSLHDRNRARSLHSTAIVGPNPILRESLSRFLHGSDFDVVYLSASVDELANSECLIDQNILVIIDACDHPGKLCHQVERFRKQHPLARIVVLANHCTPREVHDVLQSGAHGYFATIATCEDFIKSLELVMNGQTIIPSECVSPEMLSSPETAPARQVPELLNEEQRIHDPSKLPQFSERELHILRCLTEGSSNKVIARECDIAEGTVKVHVKAILRKIKVSNRTQAAIWALTNRDLLWPLRQRENSGTIPLQRERRHYLFSRARQGESGLGVTNDPKNGNTLATVGLVTSTS